MCAKIQRVKAATLGSWWASRGGEGDSEGQGAKVVAVAGPLGVVGNVAADAAGDGEEVRDVGAFEVREALVRLAHVEQARAGPFLARRGGSGRWKR